MIQLNPTLCEETNRIQLSFIHIGHAILGTWWKGSNEFLDCSQLYYIVKGSAKVLYGDNQLLVMEAGNWYLLPCGTAVTYWCEDFMEEIYFHVKLHNLDNIDLLQHCLSPCRLPVQEDRKDFFLQCIHSQNPTDGIRLRQIITSVLLDFIDHYHITLKNSKMSPCVSRAIAYMNSHLSMNLKIDEILANAFVSKSTLERRFKKELNCSVHEYLHNMVMAEAGRFLLNTNWSVGTISEHFGFCDQFYFSKRFKDKFGKSPKEFRNTAPM